MLWNVYGIDNAGKINYSDNSWNFYLKDHLGTPRVVIDQNGDIISAEDLDMWGYRMTDRSFQSDTTFYKYVSSEIDVATQYTYFVARNYNGRIGRFLSEEPLLESSFGISSYAYSINNPLRFIDPYGTKWFYFEDQDRWEFIRYWDEVIEVVYDKTTGTEQTRSVYGKKEVLLFDGFYLYWLKPDGTIQKWVAVSGVVDEEGRTQPGLQDQPDRGPIPEGWWSADPKNAYSMWKPEGAFDFLKWIWKYHSLGAAYINVYPEPNNPTKRREGFAIHGGMFPGSEGCIDLTYGMESFYMKFIRNNKRLQLQVKY